jgi:hypothetical protein
MYDEGKIEILVDFDELLKDPASTPPKLLTSYATFTNNSQDWLHPGDVGLRAVGELVYEKIAEDIAAFPPDPANPPEQVTPPPIPVPTIPPEFERPAAEDVEGDGYVEFDLSSYSATGNFDNIIYEADKGVYFTDIDSLNLPIQALATGDKLHVIVQGHYEGGQGVRSFIAQGANAVTQTLAYAYMAPGANVSVQTVTDTDYGFKWEFMQEATNSASQLLFKGHAGGTNLTGNFMIYRIYMKYERK